LALSVDPSNAGEEQRTEITVC